MDDDLEKLRNLVLGEHRQQLAETQERLQNTSRRAEDVAEVLPQAIQTTNQTPQAELLGYALKDPLETALRRSVKENPGALAEVLSPVILPAVRKSVEDALKGFLDKIDALLSNAFSVNSLRWRWESWTSGVSYREIVLRNAFVYQTEQAFLIDRKSGLLIDHAFRQNAPNLDEDAVAGMLTAIQHFFNDSFSEASNDALDKLTFGNRSIFLLHGSRASLALLVFGAPTVEYLDRQRTLLERLHEIGAADAQTRTHTPPAVLRDMLGQSLDEDTRSAARGGGSRASSWILGAVLGTAVAGLVLFFAPRAWDSHKLHRMAEQIEREQNWGVLRLAEGADGHWTLTLLRRVPPEAMHPYFTAYGIDPERVSIRGYLNAEGESR